MSEKYNGVMDYLKRDFDVTKEPVVKMKQTERVLEYCRDFGSITGLDAIIDLGIMHLPSVIRDLHKEGYDTMSEWESRDNRYGDKVSYKRYYILQFMDEVEF